MLNRGVLAVDIGMGSLKMLYGNKKHILAYQMVDTPTNTMDDNRILNLNVIYDLINSFIKKRKMKPKFISFSIHGQDIVIRHIEVPFMKEGNVKQTVEWEIGQNLPDGGAHYYIDHEILNRKEGKKDKRYQILAVAVLKDKISIYLELAKMLKLEIKAIDISANCTARVFKQLTIGKNGIRSVGIIDIGHNNTGITIIEKGRLAIERQVPFGFDKLMKEVSKTDPELTDKEFDYINNKFNFLNTQSEVDIRINKLLDNVFSSFQKIIQFYTTGKIEKEISQILIIGVGSTINGIEEIINKYLSGSAVIVKDTVTIGRKIKLPRGCELKYFVNTLGLLLRED